MVHPAEGCGTGDDGAGADESRRVRRALAIERLVWALLVVVLHELVEDPLGVALSEDDS